MMSSVLSAGPGAADSERSLTRRSIVLCKSALPVSVERRAQQLAVGEDPPLDGANTGGPHRPGSPDLRPPVESGTHPSRTRPQQPPRLGGCFPPPLNTRKASVTSVHLRDVATWSKAR